MTDLPQQVISPDVDVDMQTFATPAWPGALECVLRISLHARLEGKTVFLIEVSEAGVFELDLSNMEEAHRFVRQVAPAVLFPFARKDLASLAVAAGCQPVLLDHVDFDVILTQVIKSQRLTRAAAPAQLDVMTEKPALLATPFPAQAEITQNDHGFDCQETSPVSQSPATLSSLAEPGTALGTAPGKNKTTSLRVIAPALLSMALLAAVLAWWLVPDAKFLLESTLALVQERKSVTPPAQLASKSTVLPVVVVPEETQAALVASQARLADQPAAWFTLDMGATPMSEPLSSLRVLPLDRPLFVVAKADTLRLLYGVFPSQAAAELVRDQLQQPVPIEAQRVVTVVTIGSL